MTQGGVVWGGRGLTVRSFGVVLCGWLVGCIALNGLNAVKYEGF